MVAVPHYTLLYSTKTNTETEPVQLITKSSYPVPMLSLKYENEMKDPALTTVTIKQEYERMLKLTKHLARKRKEPEGFICEDMIKYIEMEELDPAPLVSTEFDWHFLGGNLDVINVDEKRLLVQTSMCDDYAIRLIEPTSKLEHIKLKTSSDKLFKNYGYEIMSSESLIGVRRKKTVKFIAREEMSVDQFNVESPVEFTWGKEIAASTIIHNNLIVIDVENKLIRSNIERLIADSFVKLPVKIQNNQFPISIGTLNKHVITYTDLKSLNIVDFRNGKVTNIFDKEDLFIKCEELSYHKKSLHDNLIYIASSHVLYGIDLRNTNDLLLHWNHQLVQQPAILKQLKYKDSEIICLSSNMPGDLKIFNCSKGKEENSWSVNWAPVKPQNIQQSYYKVREKGLLLFSNPIKNRVALSTTGVAMIADERNSRIKLFTQNSIGDVLKSFLFCNEDTNNNEMKLIRNFRQWDKALRRNLDPLKFVPLKKRLRNKELIVDNIERLKGLRKVMKCKKLRAPEKEPEDSQVISVKIPRWKTDLEDARHYRDVLSQHILHEWDLKIEETQPQLFAEALKNEIYKKDKDNNNVSRWLESMPDEVTVDNFNDRTFNEEDDEINMNDEQDQVLTQPNTLTQQTSATTKVNKLSQRLKGF